MTKREKALQAELREVGVRESGTNNRGPRVEAYQEADSLPGVGYAWCQSLQNFGWKDGNDEPLAGGTASVGMFLAWARQHGYIVAMPARADHVLFDFSGDGVTDDHVGQIVRVISVGFFVMLETVEGNTGAAGAVSDPGTGKDGVYRKRRVVPRSSVTFVRVPGQAPPEPTFWDWLRWRLGEGEFKTAGPSKGPRPDVPYPVPGAWELRLSRFLKARKAAVERRKAEKLPVPQGHDFWAWLRWRIGEGEFKGYARDPRVRPQVPARIPLAWWRRAAAFLAARKAR